MLVHPYSQKKTDIAVSDPGKANNLKYPSMFKQLLSLLFICCLSVSPLLAAPAGPDPDDIVGTWLNASGKGQIQIYKQGQKFYGKLVWLKEPNDEHGNPKVDIKNPNKDLRSNPVVGTVIVRDLVYKNDEWGNGRVYDPQNGKEYKCFITLKNHNTLNIRGYIGISMMGRTETWTRVK